LLIGLKAFLGAAIALFLFNFLTEYTLDQRAADYVQCAAAAHNMGERSSFTALGSVAERRLGSRRLLIWGTVRTGGDMVTANIRCIFHGEDMTVFFTPSAMMDVGMH
jgi:hypothetical protein